MIRKRIDGKKEYIAKIAVGIFFAQGFQESSLQDISNEANISKAGIYHYYKSKGEILSYILRRYADDAIDTLKDGLSKTENVSSTESLKVLIDAYGRFLLRNRKISSIVLRDRHQLTEKERKKLRDQERTIFHIFKDSINSIPNINPKINANLISFQIISMTHWMGYWFDSIGSLSEGEAISQMTNMVFNGILNLSKEKGS